MEDSRVLITNFSCSFEQNKPIRVFFSRITSKGKEQHKIIIPQDIDAYEDFVKLYLKKELYIKDIILRMKEKYSFKSNKNNKKVYKPFYRNLEL